MRFRYDGITSASKHNKNGQYGDRKITVCNMSVLGNHSVGDEIKQVHCCRQSTANTFKQICVSHIASVSKCRNDEREESKRENQNSSADLEITEVGFHGLVFWQNVSSYRRVLAFGTLLCWAPLIFFRLLIARLIMISKVGPTTDRTMNITPSNPNG